MTLAAVVLAAGAGVRLRPLTLLRPKAMCPVDNVPLVDLALERAHGVTQDVAVNVSHGRAQLEAHMAGRAEISVEEPGPAGTAGALVRLRPWIDGRDVLVVNADAWYAGSLEPLAAGWDGTRVRMLVVEDPARADFGRYRYAGASLIPWAEVVALPADAFGLYDAIWRGAVERHAVEFIAAHGPFIDCGTPADYHAANMAASGGRNVVGEGAIIDGEVTRTVVWPGARVRAGERLHNAVRASDDVTVVVGS